MVEQVESLRLKLDFVPFGEVEALHERQVDVVDGIERQRVPPDGRESAVPGLDVLRVGINRQVTDDAVRIVESIRKSSRACRHRAVAQGNNSRSRSLNAVGIQNGAVRSRVA